MTILTLAAIVVLQICSWTLRAILYLSKVRWILEAA